MSLINTVLYLFWNINKTQNDTTTNAKFLLTFPLEKPDFSAEIAAADKFFARDAPSLDLHQNISQMKHDLWEKIYAVLRLFPNGVSVNDFSQKYSQMHLESLGNKGGLL